MGAPMIEESNNDDATDLWNDPDMIQPPVVTNHEEESGAYAFEPHMNMSQSEHAASHQINQ